jgi:hypothetical protein
MIIDAIERDKNLLNIMKQLNKLLKKKIQKTSE